jgi:23S rRNA (uracil1939-C5)-methyltransferase
VSDDRRRPPRRPPAPGRAAGGRPAGGRSRASTTRLIPGDAPVVELRVEAIAAGGDGVGRHEGLVVFVPRTAPGDVARVAVVAQGRMARGALASLVTPSPDRVEPPCPHYVIDHCGGCQLQHLSAPAQRAAKRRIVADALQRIGGRGPAEGAAAVEVSEVAPSPHAWRYRRKLTLALRRRAGAWTAGLHPFDAPGRIFALQDCPITDARVLAAWRAVLDAAAFLPADEDALRGAVRLLDGSEATEATDTPWAFVLEGARRWTSWEPFADAVGRASSGFAALWWRRDVPTGAPRAEPRLLLDRRGDRAPGAAFVQVNPGVAAALHARVVDRALAHAPAAVVDAYAGAGDTAAALAAAGVRVTAIELDRAAAHHAAERLPEGSRAVAGFVERHLAEALPADVILLNPPRGGLHEAVPPILERALGGAFGAPPRAILYVSCNPATLARDLARLPSWRLRAVEPFDMFPQTAHVETLVELVPRDGPPAPDPQEPDA